MTVKELAEKYSFEALTLPQPDRIVSGGYTGDLLSWVMGRAESDNAWITIMTNVNIVAVAVGLTDCLGIDVEKCSEKVLKLQAKLGEYKQNNLSNIEYITREWTKKESAYKAGKKCEFNCRKIFDNCGEEYFLTLCSKEMLCDFIYVNAKELINK